MPARKPSRTELQILSQRLAGLLDGPRVRVRPWLDRLATTHARWAELVYAEWRRGPTTPQPPMRGPTPRLLLDRARRTLARGCDATALHRLIVDAAALVADHHLGRCGESPDPSPSRAALAVAATLQDRLATAADPLDEQRVLRVRWVWAATRWCRRESVAVALTEDLIAGFSRLLEPGAPAEGSALRLRLCVRNLGADLLQEERADEALHWHRRATSTLRIAAGSGVANGQLFEARREFAQLALDIGQPAIAVEQIESALREHSAQISPAATLPERNDLQAMLVDAYRRAGMIGRAALHIELLLHELALRRERKPSDVQAAYDESWWCGQMVQLLAEDGRFRAALPWSRSGVNLAERLASRHAEDLWPRSHCAWQTAWLAYLFLETGRNKPTRTWLHRALERVDRLPPGTAQRADLQAWLLRMEGNRLVRCDQLDRAERSLRQSLEIAIGDGERLRLTHAAAWAYEDLARLHDRRECAEQALGMLVEAIAIWERTEPGIGNPPVRDLARCYRYAAELYESCGDTERAFRYRQQADELEARET